MKINVSELLNAVGNKAKIKIEERLEFPKDEIALISPVQADLTLTNTGRGILLEGRVKARVSLTCGRCLKEFAFLLEAEISEVYKKEHKHARPNKDEIELSEADFIFPIDRENDIDMAEAIRQNLILALPIKVICSDGCSGLNRPGDGPGQKKIDPRLKKLADWKEKNNAATKKTPQ